MTPDARFWRNVIIIGVVHVVALVGLARWTSGKKQQPPAEILWLEGGAIPALQAAPVPPPVEAPPETPAPGEPEPSEPAQSPEEATPAPSEFQLPTPMPERTPIAAETPAPTATPTAKPSPSPTPKRSPSPTPKPKTKSSPTPKAKRSPTSRKKETPAPGRTPRPSTTPKPEPSATAEPKNDDAAPADATGPTRSDGAGETGAGSGRANRCSSYARMLHDRFYSQWVQPTSLIPPGARMSTLVKLRIEKDGRVSSFTIIRSSGNVVVDESVAAVAKRVTRVDPLPSGLGSGFYEVNINFELKAEQ